MSARKLWAYSVGSRGGKVRVYERTRGGPISIAVFDPTAKGGKGGYSRKSLGHRNRRAAEREARRVVSILEQGALPTRATVAYVIALYRQEQLPHVKPVSRSWLGQHLTLWERFLGPQTPLEDCGPAEWDKFKRERRRGLIDGLGRPVSKDKARPVSPGTVNLGLDVLNMFCNWAYGHRIKGKRLISENPFKGGTAYMDNPNVHRSTWTWDRFQTVVAAAETLTMQVEWSGTRKRVACCLADVLEIAEGTGRRIGAVRQLRSEDLFLGEGPHGKIRWPSETDKLGKEWRTPITENVSRTLRRVLRRRGGIGGPLFPAPRDITQPIGRDTLTRYLHRALTAAGLPRLPHDAFHGLRRKWATERKHLPDVDTATAGGWRSVNVMKRSYQQADEAGVLEAVTSPRRLRDGTFKGPT